MVLKIFLCVLSFILVVQCGGKFRSLKESSENFAADLYKNLPNSQENILISPTSIQTVLALLQTGVENNCLAELSSILYLPKNKKNLSLIFDEYLPMLLNNKHEDVNISLANTIYVKKGVTLPKVYQNFARSFKAQVQEIEFTKPIQAAQQINQWVASRTRNKINDIITANTINERTLLLLINALYFNGQWEKQFDKDLTSQRPFHALGNQEIKTDMMIQIETFNYTESKELNAKFIELPYEGGDFVMTVVLPNDKKNRDLFTNNLVKVFKEQNYEPHQVTVFLPKFEMETKFEFSDTLKKLGLRSVFNQLELKGLNRRNDIFVSQIIQKTYIDVSEIGTEAAAATGIEIEDRMGNFDRKVFMADHPFIYFIKQKSTGSILFLGKYMKPN